MLIHTKLFLIPLLLLLLCCCYRDEAFNVYIVGGQMPCGDEKVQQIRVIFEHIRDVTDSTRCNCCQYYQNPTLFISLNMWLFCGFISQMP